MSGFNYYERLLPIIDQLMVDTYRREFECELEGFFCYGPSEEDVRRLMPLVTDSMSRADADLDRYCIVPAAAPRDARALLESHAQWAAKTRDDGICAAEDTLWLPPVGFDLDRSTLPVEIELDRRAIEVLPLSLLLAWFKSYGTFPFDSICAVEDDHLCRDDVVKFLRDHGEAHPSDLEEAHAIGKVLGRLMRGKSVLDFVNDQQNAQPAWSPGRNGFPRFSWRFEAPPSSPTVTLLALEQSLTMFRRKGGAPSMHYARMPCSPKGDSNHAIDLLFDRAWGAGIKTEDDRYPTNTFIEETGFWSPSFETGVTPERLAAIGYPMVVLREVAKVSTFDLSAPRPTLPCVYISWEGDHWTRASLKRPNSSTDHTVYVLESTDADCLAVLFNTALIQEEVRERAGGSYLQPRITRGMLEALSIPWPPETRRNSWRQSIAKLAEQAEELADEVEEVAAELRDIAAELGDPVGCGTDKILLSEFDLRERVRALMSPLDKILPGIVAATKVNDEGETATLTEPPFPIAILKQKYEASDNPHEQLSLIKDRADLLCRIDALLCMAAASMIDEKIVCRALRPDDTQRSRSKCLWSQGHWVSFGTSIRKELQRYEADPTWGRMVRAVRPSCKGETTDAMYGLVQLRNDNTAHGATMSSRGTEDLIGEFLRQIETSRPRWGYLTDLLWHVPLTITPTRSRTIIRRAVLNGPLQVFDVQSFEVEQQSSLTSIHIGEIYTDLPGQAVSLWPWAIFSPSESAPRGTVWLIDGIDRKKRVAIYKSTETENEKLEGPKEGEHIAELLGL